MDLNLFGAFHGDESGTVPQSSSGRSKKRRDNETSMTITKKMKAELEKSQNADDETTIITTSMTSTSESGTTLTKARIYLIHD